MKNLYSVLFVIVAAVCIMTVAVSCKDEASNGDVRPPAPVSDATATPALGKVTLKWKVPDDPKFQYTRIDYSHPVEGTPIYSLVGKAEVDGEGYSTFVITDYEEVSEQKYVLTACGFSKEPSSPVSVETTTVVPPYKAYDVVAASVAVTGDVDGALVSWQNDMDIPVIVKASFTDRYGVKTTVETTSSADGGVRVGTFDPAVAQDLKVTVWNRSESRSSEEKSYPTSGMTITPSAQVSTAGWELTESYNDWKSDMAAGNLIDGDIKTAWHTDTNPNLSYPFYAVFDMGGDHVISRVDLVPRQEDGHNGPTRVAFELSADGEEWFNAGTFAFDNTTKDTQTYYLQQSQVSVRHIKLLLLAGPETYSMMGGLIPYGAKRD